MLKSNINLFRLTWLMRKRNKVVASLMLLVAVFIWFIGWGLYWAGSRKELVRSNKMTKPLPC